MIGLRPILSDSQPKKMKNGVPMTSEVAIRMYADWKSSLSVMMRKNSARFRRLRAHFRTHPAQQLFDDVIAPAEKRGRDA